MTRKLKNAPLVEAICEFRFDLENMFDPTLPGIIYSSIKDSFPIRKQRNIGTPVPVKDIPTQSEIKVIPLAQFYNKEETMLVQVGGNFLTVNCVKEYPTWEKFKPQITKVLEIYLQEIKPKEIIRIGLRNINKINIPGEDVNVEENFTFAPRLPENISTPFSHFNVHIETFLHEYRDVLIMKNTSLIPEKENHLTFMLDLEYAMNKHKGIKLETNAINGWLEIAHQELYNAFQYSVTPKLMNLFDQ